MKKYLVILLLSCSIPNASADMDSDKADEFYKTAIQLHGAANLEQVFALYARSAELGNAAAQYNIGMMYSNGESVWVDYQQAVYWFRKSAAQNFSPAQYRLGEMYLFEKGGLPKDLSKAVALFEQAAAQHDADAQMNLAMLNGTGEGMPLNTGKALYWIGRAAKVGSESAELYRNLLAESRDTGFSADQKHYYWIKKAAELGIIEAQKALKILDSK